MTEVLANLAASKLAAQLNSAATSLTVLTGEGALFPSTGNFRLTIEDEILLCTGRASDTLTVVRGQEGTSDVTHVVGKDVVHTLTKAGLDVYLLEQAQTAWMIALD